MRIALGTEKGAYLVDPGTDEVTGPEFPGWKVTAFGRTPGGDHIAALASNWFGVAIHRSPDWKTWTQVEAGPSFGPDRELSQIWTFHTEGLRIYAGVAEAGLFYSDDDGLTWTGMAGLNEHRTREDWFPGFGGLCAHRILTGDDSMWVAISAVGVFRSDDGGRTWVSKNSGIPSTTEPEGEPPEVGYCVHNLDHDRSSPRRMWRQDHRGVFRSTDGGDHWERIEAGLPAGFGFVVRRDHQSGRLFVVPLHSDANRVPVDGAFRAYASDDDGESWSIAGTGWNDAPNYTSVLRGAVAADGNGTVVLGTTGGNVWLTTDTGESWRMLNATFPRIGAVSIL